MFKVGDRVKIDHVDASLSSYEGHQQLVGKVGRVVSVDTADICPIAVQVGGALHPGGLRCACFAESELRLVKTTGRRAPMPPHTISEEGWEYADWAHDFYGDR